MSLFYRLMGWVALLCARMSRYRVNGIPSHFWIIIACIAALGIGGDIQRRDAAAFGKPPVPMTLSQALSGGKINQYVAVTGLVDGGTTIVGKGSGDQETYVPMVDPKTRQALLVKRQGATASTAAPATVTGVFRQVPSDLYGHLKDNSFQLGQYTVSTDFQLDEGDAPIDPRTYFITLFVAGLPLALILASVAQKHVIFQRTPRAFGAGRELGQAVSADADAPVMRLSGKLRLGPKTAQRFLEVPVALAEMASGKQAFVSKINASIKQTDGSIQDRTGLWAAVIEDGSLRVDDEGTLYLGRSVRPALRVRYLDSAGAKPAHSVAVLSFENEAERAAVMAKLQEVGQKTR